MAGRFSTSAPPGKPFLILTAAPLSQESTLVHVKQLRRPRQQRVSGSHRIPLVGDGGGWGVGSVGLRAQAVHPIPPPLSADTVLSHIRCTGPSSLHGKIFIWLS